MGTLYENIISLCEANNKKPGSVCNDLGISRGIMTDLKSGRKKGINAETANKIANYFDVSVDYLLTGDKKERPLVNGDEELTEYLEMLRDRPECRMLFQLSKNATKEDVEQAVKIIEALRK
ncbi:MAG: helix-turn-helix transcriptional regulator [Oscillospiraceae bacterium]|nr:helix-turn-helix transcriptional regulator [Oscillospiraceae bacterium]